MAGGHRGVRLLQLPNLLEFLLFASTSTLVFGRRNGEKSIKIDQNLQTDTILKEVKRLPSKRQTFYCCKLCKIGLR